MLKVLNADIELEKKKGPAETDPCSNTFSVLVVLSCDSGNVRCDHQGNDGHQLDEDIHRRAGSILERVADRVAGYRGLVRFALFVMHFAVDLDAFLKRFFGV